MVGRLEALVSMHTARDQIAFDIDTLINECQPNSILTIGEQTKSFVSNYVAQKNSLNQKCIVRSVSFQDSLAYLQESARYDVGVVADTLEFLDKDESGQLIARLRDLHTARFVLVIRIGDQWQDLKSVWQTVDLLGFGMKLVNRYHVDDKPIHIYKYDITTYKKTPEWLNSKNWANPQLWDRFRW